MNAPLDVTCRDLQERFLRNGKCQLLRRLVQIEREALRPEVMFPDAHRVIARGIAFRLYRSTVAWLMAWRRGVA